MNFDQTIAMRQGAVRIPAGIRFTPIGSQLMLFIQTNMFIYDMRYHADEDQMEYIGQSMLFDQLLHQPSHSLPQYRLVINSGEETVCPNEKNTFRFERLPYIPKGVRQSEFSFVLDKQVFLSKN